MPPRRGLPRCSSTATIRTAWPSWWCCRAAVCKSTASSSSSASNTSGLANVAIEPNIGGSNDGEVIFGYGFVNLSDRALKENVRAIPEEELQEIVEPQLFDRIDGGREQIGFVAQDVQASSKLGATMCKVKNLDGRELMALDYQKLSVVLWGVVKKLQRRVEGLEKKKKRKDSD